MRRPVQVPRAVIPEGTLQNVGMIKNQPTPAMIQVSTQFPIYTIGFDIGDSRSFFEILDADGAVVRRGSVGTTEDLVRKMLSPYRGGRIVIEASTHSPWLAEVLESMGLEVIVADPRMIPVPGGRRRRKSDKIDAALLARMGRADPKMLRRIQHRPFELRPPMSTVRQRACLVRMRTQAINCIRGQLKSLNGIRVRKCSSEAFAKAAREAIPEEMLPVFRGLLDVIQRLTDEIKAKDKEVEQLATAHPAVKTLCQVTGVGSLTALTFALTIQDHRRFSRSRTVGAYLGLTPQKFQSGDSDPALSISKCGDVALRTLLIQAAHYVLGNRNKVDSDLRRFGLRMAGDGSNRIAKRKAVVAVARKIAVLLHALWRSGATYQPLRKLERQLAPEPQTLTVSA